MLRRRLTRHVDRQIMRIDVSIRPYAPRDAGAVASLGRQLSPQKVWSAEHIGWWVDGVREPGRLGLWVAEEQGRLVGWIEGWLLWFTGDPERALVWGVVDAPYRRRGIGGRLYDVALTHVRGLGAVRLHGNAELGSAGARFLERHEWRCTREEHWFGLDPSTVDTTALDGLGSGVSVVPWSDVDPHGLWEVHSAGAMDVPGDLPREREPFDEWSERLLGNPLLAPGLSHAVVVGGRVVATSALLVDREAAVGEHALTATAKPDRGKGYALLAKLGVIRAATDAGLRRLGTANDYENAPMLGVNRRLGYRPSAVRGEYELVL
jgi:GNAT superfamily N-acetyltransferase